MNNDNCKLAEISAKFEGETIAYMCKNRKSRPKFRPGSKGKQLLMCAKIAKAGRNFGHTDKKPEYECLNNE